MRKTKAAAPSLPQVGSDDEGYAVRLKLKHFAHYLASPEHSRDDSPLYIFDGTFADRDVSRCLLPCCTPFVVCLNHLQLRQVTTFRNNTQQAAVCSLPLPSRDVSFLIITMG